MDSLIRIDYRSKENYWSPTSLGVEDSTAENFSDKILWCALVIMQTWSIIFYSVSKSDGFLARITRFFEVDKAHNWTISTRYVKREYVILSEWSSTVALCFWDKSKEAKRQN